MLASKMYCPTLREDPAEADVASHKYMLKAGMIRKNAAGIYSFLPMGRRVVLKIENIVREEMDAAGQDVCSRPQVGAQFMGIVLGKLGDKAARPRRHEGAIHPQPVAGVGEKMQG